MLEQADEAQTCAQELRVEAREKQNEMRARATAMRSDTNARGRAKQDAVNSGRDSLNEDMRQRYVLDACLFYLYMPAVDTPLSDCRYATNGADAVAICNR